MTDTTDTITIYHNPFCGTSRSTLALLEEHNVPHRFSSRGHAGH